MTNKSFPFRFERDTAPADWSTFVLPEDLFMDFPVGSRVVDVGCGDGTQLAAVEARGCTAVGADVSVSALRNARARGLRVIAGAAEALPFSTACSDGVVCKVVLPYTDEARAIAEIGRLLRRDGKIILCTHGVGYYLRYLASGSWRRQLYALRTLLNTWVYRVTQRRLPGFLGDTLYQSRRRLARCYAAAGLVVLHDFPTRRFLGFAVFIYQVASKR